VTVLNDRNGQKPYKQNTIKTRNACGPIPFGDKFRTQCDKQGKKAFNRNENIKNQKKSTFFRPKSDNIKKKCIFAHRKSTEKH